MEVEFADFVRTVENPFLNMPKAPPYAKPPIPAPAAALEVFASTARLGAAETQSANKAWSYATSQAWRAEEIAEIEAKIVAEKAEIAASKRAAAGTPFRGASRVLGILTIPLIAADIFEIFAPGVQGWLKGGWAGHGGEGLPETAGKPTAGACQTGYDASYKGKIYSVANGSQQFGFANRAYNVAGPLGTPYGVSAGGLFQVYLPTGNGPYLLKEYLQDPSNPLYLGDAEQTDVQRRDGQPDDCLGAPAPNPITANPVVTDSPFRPSPQPGPPERDPSGSPITPFLPFSPFTIVPPGTVLPTDSPFGTQPSPNPYTTTPTRPDSGPDGRTYPPAPYSPPGPLTKGDGCSPCAIKTGDKLDDIKKKLDEIDDGLKEKGNGAAEGYIFRYPVCACVNGSPIIAIRALTLLANPGPGPLIELEAVASLAAKSCGEQAPLAMPDYWQVRIGADRPQIVVTYRVAGTSSYKSISLPHPASTSAWKSNLLGDYEAGPYAGMMTLRDNSKVIINCSSEVEANRMLSVAEGLISPAMMTNPPTRHVSKRQGAAVKVTRRVGRRAAYFPTGQLDAVPMWSEKVR